MIDPNTGEVAEFSTSPTTEKLDAALAKAQAEIGTAKKDKVNPAFKSRYADLEAVWDACRDALTKNGINVTQWPIHSADGRLHIVTRMACAGEWMRAHFSMPVSKADAHGAGSAISYAKRYTLSAAVGVTTGDEDDDGNAATRPASPGATSGTAPPSNAARAAEVKAAARATPGRRVPIQDVEEPPPNLTPPPGMEEPSAPAEDEVLIPFGRSKGKPVSGASAADLDYLESYARKAIDDPSKARYRDGNERLLRAVHAARGAREMQGEAPF